MKQKDKLQKKPEALAEEPVALDLEDLNEVTGAGNPFSNVPRVPEQPIDPELRGDA